MVDSVYIVSKDYEVEFMNKLLIDEFGDQVGRICYEAFHDREEPCPQCKSEEVMKEKTVRWEWHSRRMNKDYDLIETPLKNIDGTISKLTIFRDITERKRAEEESKHLTLSLREHVKELEESQKKIAEAYRLREHFLKETSHRIITPVAIIGGNSQLLLESSNLDEDQKERIRIIREKNEEIQKLVKDALTGKYLEDREEGGDE